MVVLYSLSIQPVSDPPQPPRSLWMVSKERWVAADEVAGGADGRISRNSDCTITRVSTGPRTFVPDPQVPMDTPPFPCRTNHQGGSQSILRRRNGLDKERRWSWHGGRRGSGDALTREFHVRREHDRKGA